MGGGGGPTFGAWATATPMTQNSFGGGDAAVARGGNMVNIASSRAISSLSLPAGGGCSAWVAAV